MIARTTQQSLTAALGEQRALRACAPTCFYMVGQAAGALPAELGLVAFCQRLDWSAAFSPERGWVRPVLARQLRQQYGMAIVSWQLGGNTAADEATIARMVATGYLATPREIEFYRQEVVGRDVAELVAEGYPVIAGMKAGFGVATQTHAVVLLSWAGGQVEVIDPDDRNARRWYPEAVIRQFLNPIGGGATIVLPH